MHAGTNTRSADSPMQSSDQYLRVEGARLRYRDEGRGPAVLCIHGWTLDLDMWEPQVAALATAFRIVRLDRRGFGMSSGRPSLASDVADVQALLRQLGLQRAALVGMSQGARVALRLARVAPDCVSCLVLDGPPDEDAASAASADDDVPLARYRALLRTRGVGAVRQEWARHPLMRLQTRDAAMRALLDRMIARYPGLDLREAGMEPDGHATGQASESIRMPALVLTGQLDLASRQLAADSLAYRLPAAERVVVGAAGHLPNLDNPQAYNSLLREFLARHAAATC
jgi:pimeloyl-ACP methyl ester carboxylesterase